MGKLLDFLFGKKPDIFDSKGNVRHQLSDSKWEAWKKRYTSGPDYNWRNHTGTKAGATESKTEHQ